MNKRTKIVVAALTNISLLTFSLIMMLTSSTLSWFGVKTTSEASTTNFGVQDCNDIVINVDQTKVYYWDTNNNCALVDNSGANVSLSLNAYDTYITSRNAYNARYVIVELEFVNTVYAGRYLNIDFTCVGSFLKTKDAEINSA